MPVLLRYPAETVVAIYGLTANENDYSTSPWSGLALTEQASHGRENRLLEGENGQQASGKTSTEKIKRSWLVG
jgi:hypothetical protein